MIDYHLLKFLGLSLNKYVPDQKTIWLFRETLTKTNTIEKLFRKFDAYLEQKNLIAHKGQLSMQVLQEKGLNPKA